MTRLSKKLLTSSNDKELLPTSLSTSAGHALSPVKRIGKAVVDTSTLVEWGAPVPKEVSDSEPSSVEGDLLPDEEALIAASNVQALNTEAGSAMRLAKWLANRVGSDPEEIYPEIAELLYGKSMAVPKLGTDSAKKPLPHLPLSNTNSLATDVTLSMVPRLPSDKDPAHRQESYYHQGHRRGFSFLPGDDAKQPVVFFTKGSTRDTRNPTPLVDVLARNNLATQSTHSLDSSSSFAGPLQSPQREASGGSTKTAIRGSTRRSSSESTRASSGKDFGPDGTGVVSKRRNHPTAVAAARAASNSGLPSRRQERTLNVVGHDCHHTSGEGLQGAKPHADIPLLGNVSHLPILKPGGGYK